MRGGRRSQQLTEALCLHHSNCIGSSFHGEGGEGGGAGEGGPRGEGGDEEHEDGKEEEEEDKEELPTQVHTQKASKTLVFPLFKSCSRTDGRTDRRTDRGPTACPQLKKEKKLTRG